MARPTKADALRFLDAGRHSEALTAYRSLSEEPSADADIFFNLGWLERQAGEPERARSAYLRALEVSDPQSTDILVNLASLSAGEFRRHDEAIAYLEQALRLDPASLPALINLGNLLEDEGSREKAVSVYRKALRQAPGHPLVLARLAGLARDEAPDGALANEIRKLLAHRELHPADAADLGFGLGKLLDRAGAYPEAFGVFAKANAAARATWPPHARPYSVDEESQLIGRLMPQEAPSPDEPHRGSGLIFVCGAYRSGSTLLEQVLGAHPQITNGGELTILDRVLKEEGFSEGSAHDLDDTQAKRMAERYLEFAAEAFPGSDRLTDKRPDNIFRIPLIRRLFPAAQVVVTERDLRDNALSIFFTHLSPAYPYATDLVATASHLTNLRRLGSAWSDHDPEHVRSFSYEKFIADPEARARELFAWLGLDWTEEALSFHERRNSVQTESVWQVRQPLYGRSVGRWRNYEAQLSRLLGDLD